jgi:hypothetical protein
MISVAEQPMIRAVRRQLRLTGATREREPVLYQLAIELGETLDYTTSARETPALSRELRAVFDTLTARAQPAKVEVDPLDDLAARRAARVTHPASEVRPAADGDAGS